MSFEQNRSTDYSLEGNIGSGKSTFILILDEYSNQTNNKMVNIHNTRVVEEPVNIWQDMNGSNVLESFYKDPKRYSFTFQMTTFVTRTELLEKALNYGDSFVIAERSVLTDKNVFSKNCYESGLMNEMEYSVYQEMFNYLNKKTQMKPKGVIYIRTDPNECLRRINERNRGEESKISIEYLTNLHEKHENWLLNQKQFPVLILDGNQNFKQDNDIKTQFLDKVNDFISINDC